MRQRARKSRHLLVPALAGLTLVACVLAVGWPAQADSDDCFPVFGTFSSQALPSDRCDSPVGLCTRGALTGVLNGDYSFTMSTLQPSGASGTPGVSFYTGQSEIDTRRGALVVGTDTGTIDLNPTRWGNFTALITVTDGTEHLSGASGQLVLRGQLDQTTGRAEGHYSGRICFPDDS